jgi:hypothetical protein
VHDQIVRGSRAAIRDGRPQRKRLSNRRRDCRPIDRDRETRGARQPPFQREPARRAAARIPSVGRSCGSRGRRWAAVGGCTARRARTGAGVRATRRCLTRSASIGWRWPPPTSRRSCWRGDGCGMHLPNRTSTIAGRSCENNHGGLRRCGRTSRRACALPPVQESHRLEVLREHPGNA